MPAQGVATDQLAVGGRPVDEVVGAGPVEASPACCSFISLAFSFSFTWIGKDSRSIESHFMLFSGVTWPKSCWMICALLPLCRRPWSVATPKYSLPWSLNLAFTLVEELWGGVTTVLVPGGLTTVLDAGGGLAVPGRHCEYPVGGSAGWLKGRDAWLETYSCCQTVSMVHFSVGERVNLLRESANVS